MHEKRIESTSGTTEKQNKLIWSDRWRMGALTKTELINIGFASVLIGFLFVLFHIFGNKVENVATNSAFQWMVSRWGDQESFGADYSHGYLIPFVSVWVVWRRRETILAAKKQLCHWGLVLIVCALTAHWMGAKMQQTRISLLSLILLIWAVPYYFYGWKVAKQLIFPCAYLIFCVPLNFLDALSGPLQRVAVAMGYSGIDSLGIECQRVGNMLKSPFFQLNVEEACSGLRSLLAMTALSAVYANIMLNGVVKQWILFLASIPIAVVGNAGRIISIALVSVNSGQTFGAGLHHDWAGYVFFAIAICLMISFAYVLTLDYKESFKSWKKTYLNPS